MRASVMGKLLALDIGAKRIGYAVSDSDQVMAFPRETLLAKPKEEFFRALKKIIEEDKITGIVIGIPLGQENEEGPAAVAVRKIGEEIGAITGLPVEFIDEHGSTAQALAKIPLRKQRREKGFRDAIAAQIILERYLNTRQ